MTVGELGIIGAILVLAFKPGIMEQVNRIRKRIRKLLRWLGNN